ncbi:unnamed protein product [Didymodactylos carnosus]|uniref:Uncharacterized protein n=1 Tax=Didymodactylos carnosus TaxID=1234261 RepID=A0A815D9G6_9BILA|nr:unnamed protein product [Didymodactylos carnosus]CAF4117974.1 unnamed protein product [Didymodactylos carnosus]
MKNVIVGAIWPGKKKSDKQQICEIISRISSKSKTLEQPTPYSLASYNGTCVPLSIYLIALTCDKPAQSLIQGETFQGEPLPKLRSDERMMKI